MAHAPSPKDLPEGITRAGVELDALGARAMVWGAHALALRANRAATGAAQARKRGRPERAASVQAAGQRHGVAAGRLFLRFEDQHARTRISALGARFLGLRGRFLDAEGKPLVRHAVVLTDQGGQRIFGHGETDFRGWFAFRAADQAQHTHLGSFVRRSLAARSVMELDSEEEAFAALVQKYGNEPVLRSLRAEMESVAQLAAFLEKVPSPAELAAALKRAGGVAELGQKLGVEMAPVPSGRSSFVVVLQGRDANGIILAQRELAVPRLRLHIRADLRLGTGRRGHGVAPGGELHLTAGEPVTELRGGAGPAPGVVPVRPLG